MATEYYFPPVMNGQMIVRSGFKCKCGKTSCDGCINRENHLRSRTKEQRLINESIAEQAAEAARIAEKDQMTMSAEVIQKPVKPQPEEKPAAPKAKRTRKTTKKPSA
jgi:hypothetical protein